ncbi:MAG: ATP/GTP-binding protein [Algoriphagus aquaeductus]|uniref:AAA family ATPase n=1 Tax=Algoriphagus aquaeductus TaxID=475299 RepID=UPI0038792F55
MILEFSIENYLSFKEKVTFSFEAASIKEHPDHVFETEDGKYNILLGALLYGANGSGKSNLIKSLSTMKDLVINSSKDKQVDEEIPVEFFKLSTETINKPSSFEVAIIQEGEYYRYGFSVSKEKIHREWLFTKSRSKEILLFSREFLRESNSYDFNIHHTFKDSDPIDPSIARKNALFLSVNAQFNGNVSMQIVKWFSAITFISGTNYSDFIEYTADLISEGTHRRFILEVLQAANLGFHDIKVQKKEITDEMLTGLPIEFKKLFLSSKNRNIINIRTIHTKRDHHGRKVGEVEFDLMTEESLGSQKFFALTGPILNSLVKGSLLVIDEFDARLHPDLSKFIIQIFQNTTNNSRKAQFLFSSHNTQFLDRTLFRRDELFFIDKTDRESSYLYNINNMSKLIPDMPNVRNDASFEKDYLEGKYGAVPFNKRNGRQLNLWDLIKD